MMEAANGFWTEHAPDFIKRKEAAFAVETEFMVASGYGRKTTTTDEEARKSRRLYSKLSLPSDLLRESLELFETYHNPEIKERLNGIAAQFVEEIGEEGEDVGFTERMFHKISKHEKVESFKRTLTQIYNPLSDENFDQPAAEAAEKAIGTFLMKAVLTKAKAVKAYDESDMALKKSYVTAFDALLAELPPAFAKELVDMQIEHDARENGHETRHLPEGHVQAWKSHEGRIVAVPPPSKEK